MMDREQQTALVLDGIRRGGEIVHGSYLADVLCLASRGSLTADEMQRLRLPDGRAVFSGGSAG